MADALVSILEYAGLAKVDSGKLTSMVKQDDLPSPVTIIRSNVKDTSIFPSFFSQTSTRSVDRPEPLRSDFAEYRDENVIIRVRKNLPSIAFAKSFLELVEDGVRLAGQAEKAPETKAGEEVRTN